MKISKLFHSLYALLMLAPVFAVGGAMAFNIINDKAVDNAQNEDITYQKVNYQYQSNNVTTLYNENDDFYYYDINTFLVGNIYKFSFDLGADIVFFDDFGVNSILFYVGFDYDDNSTPFINIFNIYASSFPYQFDYLSYNGSYDRNRQTYSYTIDLDNADDDITLSYNTFNIPLASSGKPFIIAVYNGGFNMDYFNPEYVEITSCPYEYIPYTLEEVNVTYPDNLSDNFYYALDSMNNSEVFSWAKTSFIAEPFSYIFGLFGIPTGSPFITLLSYWLSISVIWLVFDLIMVVPLLVHSWIDKGVIE